MKYQTLLFDADGTLLDFQKAEARGICAAFQKNNLPFNARILALYSQINRCCWEEFEQGLLDKETLLVERFRRLFAQLGLAADPAAIALAYREELGRGAYLIRGAYELCEELGRSYDLYIITNGVAATQYSRFALSGLDRLVRRSFISEEIGYPKPQKEYFDYVFSQIPGFRKEKALIIGDSLTADIQGGIRMQVDTCWYNPAGLARPAGLQITYEIHDLEELKTVLQ